MNKDAVFQILGKKKQQQLLAVLEEAWDQMSTPQRWEVFDGFINEARSDIPAIPEDTIKAVKQFQKDSLDGVYYAPFDINSKNFMDIPEETDAWFATLDELFAECAKLTRQKEHRVAVDGFDILYALIDRLGDDEIVFADELGMWMFPGDMKDHNKAYIQAASAICPLDEFKEKALSVISEDHHSGGANKTYSLVKSIGTPEQMALVDQVVQDRKLITA